MNITCRLKRAHLREITIQSGKPLFYKLFAKVVYEKRRKDSGEIIKNMYIYVGI